MSYDGVVLRDVNFAYGGKIILEGFSQALPSAAIVGLSGASGCGKTTLLRLIAGQVRPNGGSIFAPSDTAFMFQENRLLPGLTAAGQIRAVTPRGTDPVPWLKMVWLEAEAGAKMGALSGGMRRRVALARCLAFGAGRELILLDEPFAGVDPDTSRRIMENLRGLGVPVIYSAHDAESLALADRVVRFEGPPLRVI